MGTAVVNVVAQMKEHVPSHIFLGQSGKDEMVDRVKLFIEINMAEIVAITEKHKRKTIYAEDVTEHFGRVGTMRPDQSKTEEKPNIDKQEMLRLLFTEIEVKTEGLVPTHWRYRGNKTWIKCKYEEEDE